MKTDPRHRPPAPTCYAVIPAAGQSRRMRPHHKLLLQWNGKRLIDHLLDAWTESLVQHVIIVVRRNDGELQTICREHGSVEVVVPNADPEDMKRSIGWGLEHIQQTYQPESSDRWLVAPADLPTLGVDLINDVVRASRHSASIVVPRFGDRQGHPVSFPWHAVSAVWALESDQGINHLVSAQPTDWLELPASKRPTDVDNPEDYQRLQDHGETG
jgi:molybdenum cofactor cytidylyltransferase